MSEAFEDLTDTNKAAGADEFKPADGSEENQKLEEELAFCRAELAKQKDDYLRLYATLENQKRKFSQDLPVARDQAVGRFVKETVMVMIDNLESSLQFSNQEADEGLSLTLKDFNQRLQSQGITVIDPLHQPFDPKEHEAMTMQPSDEHPKNTVLQVVQKGYRLRETLIRPARVIVADGPAKTN